MYSAYKELTTVIAKRKEANAEVEGSREEVDIVVADGHKSRFNLKVMEHCENNGLEQHILPPDPSGLHRNMTK